MTSNGLDPVTHEQCDECGFDAGRWSRAGALEELAALSGEWQTLIASADPAALQARPQPTVWSAVEYTVHTAHVARLWHELVLVLLMGGVPVLDPDRYPDADHAAFNAIPPAVAAADLTSALTGLATLAGSLDDAGWATPLRLSPPEFESHYHREGLCDVEDVVLHTLHDALHHFDDIRRSLA